MEQIFTALLTPTTSAIPSLATPVIIGFMLALNKNQKDNNKTIAKAIQDVSVKYDENSRYVAQSLQHVSSLVSLLIATESDERRKEIGEKIIDNLSQLEHLNETNTVPVQ